MTPDHLKATAAGNGQAGEAAPRPEHAETSSIRPETPSDPPPRLPGGKDPAQGWIGKSLGKYQVIGVLGRGGMGVVLKAYDPMIEREVAIKVLAEHLAADATALGRFLAEAKAAGKLNHPNVVAIHEICQEGQTFFLVQEFAAGGSLEDRLAFRKPMPVPEATQAMIDACMGIGAAHAVGLIHRDIKPANFMRAADGTIKVVDFGLAKVAGEAGRNLTQAGTMVGTPLYMSPEQCSAKPLDHRTDIYSLGATYYSLLTGKEPYPDAETVSQLMYLHCHGPILDPKDLNATVPPVCSRIIARAMAKAPADRYPSANEMLADLLAVAAAPPDQPPQVLPSEGAAFRETRVMSPAAPQPPDGGGGMTALQRRNLGIFAGLFLVGAIGLALFLWRPWQKAPEDLPAAAGPPRGEPVKVGVLHSLSGTMANSESVVVDAVMFAIEEVNQEGGVLGRPVKAVVADGCLDEAIFAREAERLIAEEQVCTVFGCWTSASRKAVKPIFEKHDHLLVYPLQYEGLETSTCIIYMGAAPNQQILPAVDWAVSKLGKKRFFLVGSDYVFPHAANAIIKDYLQRAGAEVVDEKYVPLGSLKVKAVVGEIARLKPDMILNTINGDSNLAFFRALRTAGIKSADTPTLSFSVGAQELRSLNRADVEGDYAAWTYFQSIVTPQNADFVRRFREKYPQRDITDPMESAYAGVKLWAKAANEAQSLDPPKIRRAMLNQRLDGPGGEIRIDPDTQHCFRTPRIGQFQGDGQFKIIWTAPAPIRPEPFPNSRQAEAWRAFLIDLHAGWGNRWSAPEAEPAKTPSK